MAEVRGSAWGASAEYFETNGHLREEMPRFTLERIGVLSGLAAPMAFMSLYVYAMLNDPSYVFFENYLSALGVGQAAWAFNLAVMVAGVLIVTFALLGLRSMLGKSHLDLAAVLLLSVSGVSLFCIGVFTEDYGDVHLLFSIVFFLVLLAFLGIFTVVLHVSGLLGSVGTDFTLAAFLFGLLLVFFGANPRTETLAVLTVVVWSTVLCVMLLVSKAHR